VTVNVGAPLDGSLGQQRLSGPKDLNDAAN
jgi:hypothetical protein